MTDTKQVTGGQTCKHCGEEIAQGPGGFWNHKAGHACCGPNKFAEPSSPLTPTGGPAEAIVDALAISSAITFLRESGKPLYADAIARLEGARADLFTVAVSLYRQVHPCTELEAQKEITRRLEEAAALEDKTHVG